MSDKEFRLETSLKYQLEQKIVQIEKTQFEIKSDLLNPSRLSEDSCFFLHLILHEFGKYWLFSIDDKAAHLNWAKAAI